MEDKPLQEFVVSIKEPVRVLGAQKSFTASVTLDPFTGFGHAAKGATPQQALTNLALYWAEQSARNGID